MRADTGRQNPPGASTTRGRNTRAADLVKLLTRIARHDIEQRALQLVETG